MKLVLVFNNKNWPLPIPPVADSRLRFVANENSTFGLNNLSSVSTVLYSLDGTNWTDLTTSTTVNLSAGDTAYLRGKISGNLSNSNYTKFTMTGSIACYGNIMYLYDYETLPTTISYTYTFNYLFDGCSSLTSAPELLATTLTSSCYNSMFYGCTSLNYVKCLATDISAGNCTTNWLNDVSSTGTFVKAASMSDWTTGVSGIPDGWTVQDATA